MKKENLLMRISSGGFFCGQKKKKGFGNPREMDEGRGGTWKTIIKRKP
jgi:hypothetical protein